MRRIAKKQQRELCDLHVCYEASGCGFWIARRLLQMGVRCEVIAPSLIPTRSGDRVKTDKRDSIKLAKSLRSNDLVAVNIPDSTDEAIRDLCRTRTDAVDDLRRAKTRLRNDQARWLKKWPRSEATKQFVSTLETSCR